MGIIYAISLLALVICFILIKKTDKKLNILGFIAITIGTVFCYNTFICYILTFFKLPVTLSVLSLTNTISTLILIFYIKRKSKIHI